MKWIYDGLGGGHNGEYDHTCSFCGYTTWFASYNDPNMKQTPCPKCKQIPNNKK